MTIMPPATDTTAPPRRVQLRRTKGWRKPPGAIVVSRPSKWGNPFEVWDNGGWWADPFDVEAERMGYAVRVSSREAGRGIVTQAYRHALGAGWFLGFNRDDVRDELRGHDLCCWCPLDQPCHADVLLEIANR